MLWQAMYTVGALIGTLGLSSAAVIPRQLNNNFPNPNDDPFYKTPSNIDNYQPGQVIESRPVPLLQAPFSTLQMATQLRYRSTDNLNRSISNVATLFKAPNPRSPPAILAYTFAEDSLNVACAPSFGFSSLLTFPGDRNTLILSYQIIAWAILNGIHVIGPDAEGPESTWLVGLTEGQTTLDSIRATIDYLDLDASDTKVTLHGYSGAAHAAAWAGSLAATYAPELNIVGSAVGGTPFDLQTSYSNINGSYVAGLATGALFGLSKGWPELNRTFVSGRYSLTSDGQAAYDDLTARDHCIPSRNLYYTFKNVDAYYNTPPLNNPTVQKILKKETMLKFGGGVGSSVPTYPRMIYHSLFDEVIPYAPVKQYVDEQCAQPGANIIFAPTVIPEHVVTAIASILTVTTFLGQAYDGTTPQCRCGDITCIPPIVRNDALLYNITAGLGLNLTVSDGRTVLSASTTAGAGGGLLGLGVGVGIGGVGLSL